MTALTTQWACRNSAISDTSADAIGSADCATSAGFIGGILSPLYLRFEHDLFRKPAARIMLRPNPPGAIGCRFRSRASGAAKCASARASLVSHGGPVQSRALLPPPTCQNKGY